MTPILILEAEFNEFFTGIAAEEVLYACEENEETNTTSEMGLANPAVHFFRWVRKEAPSLKRCKYLCSCRGLRHRNLSAIRHATQRGLHQLQQLNAHTEAGDPHARRVHGQTPLGVQGFRTNPKGNLKKNSKLSSNHFAKNRFRSRKSHSVLRYRGSDHRAFE